jgi:hypothetical protein
VISFIALKYEADIASDPVSAGQAISPAASHLCVISNIYFLSIHAPEDSRLPTAIQFDGIEVPGLLFATRRGDRYLIAGHAPQLLENIAVIRTVCLSTSSQRTTLRFFDRPLRVQKGDDALMMVMDLLSAPDRAGVVTFILRVLSSLVGTLDAPLALMVRDVLRAHATEREARAYVLDGEHFYWRAALPKGLEHPATVAVRCFLLHDQQLVQVSCGKALRTAAGGLHMLSRKPSTFRGRLPCCRHRLAHRHGAGAPDAAKRLSRRAQCDFEREVRRPPDDQALPLEPLRRTLQSA